MAQLLLLTSIGTKLVKGLVSLWLGDRAIAKLTSDLTFDFFEKYTKDFYEARRAKRFFEELADRISGDLASFLESEHKALPKGDALQIMESSIEIISTDEFYDLCIAERLSFERILKACSPQLDAQAKKRLLKRSAQLSIFRFLLMEFITVLSSLPQFNRVAFRKILEDTEVILERIARLQSKLDDVTTAADNEILKNEHVYRRNFARRFRKIQLFGIDSRGLEKKYDLSIGYISLTISSHRSSEEASGQNVEDVLARNDILDTRFNLLVGAPGSGKTTILSWLAMNAADRSLPPQLTALHSMTPVFFAFREYADRPLPLGQDILVAQVGALADALDPKWIRQQLKAGSFLFLLDGFDEVTEQRRSVITSWILELSRAFPESKFFITSRPYASDSVVTEIASEPDNFNELHVEPMDIVQINEFVKHWYDCIHLRRRRSSAVRATPGSSGATTGGALIELQSTFDIQQPALMRAHMFRKRRPGGIRPDCTGRALQHCSRSPPRTSRKGKEHCV
ncbi:hypothetical protein XI03_35720 [Bradyrhizobium sp. CCBAU 65884]|uniref:NACHT domain-containing protein n=1 Tax=Bradyrhizobium sp. CCBAU 65884 TaxID=722477 RepID=UPI002304DB48|nr:NACHT domain-containing protein [Bradyrhizobium sp. CCBAU 65884]MDA9479752.1 hypothetical protein [Bradyrhizobium sp. CCBAU 65884]